MTSFSWFTKLFKKKELVIDTSTKLCPVCNLTMEKIMKYNIMLDRCPKCTGIWFDENEFDKLIKRV